MKTSITIADSLVYQLLNLSKARSRNEAVNEAIVSYIAHKQREKAVAALGTFDDFMTQEELASSRDAS
jgi:metal-responsive CopG/Arc/MetJ family transcriptional regulator